MTPEDARRLGGLSHSRAHMRRLNRISPKTGRPPYRTYAELMADPRMAKAAREIQREFCPSTMTRTDPVRTATAGARDPGSQTSNERSPARTSGVLR